MAPPRGQAAQPQQHSKMLRYIAIVSLALIVLVGLIVLIAWLSIQPKKLKYSIEHGKIMGYNLTNDQLNANFKFVLRANNPNRRVSLYYDRIDVVVSFEDQKLSINNVHPFYQPRRNVTYLDLNLLAKNASVHGTVGQDLKLDRESGKLELDVKIRSKIRFKVGVFKIHRILKIHCSPVTVPFDSGKEFDRVFCDVDVD